MRLLLAISAGCAALATQSSASELYFQDFSTQGSGYSTSVSEFSDGGFDFFTQSDANSVNSSVNYNGADGAYFAGMDLDGEGASLPLTLTTSAFDISNATNLQFMIDLAEDGSNDGNNDWDSSDSVAFEYQVDGGGWVSIFSAVNSGDPFNSAAFVNGVQITDTFSTFTADLSGVTGSTMEIRLVWQLNAGDEDLAIDNITLSGTVAVVPLPPAAFAGLGLLAALGAHRKFKK